MGRETIRAAVVGSIALVWMLASAAGRNAEVERRIAVYAGEFAPYVSAGEAGPHGIMVDLLRAIGRRAEVRFDITVVPWRRAQRLVAYQGHAAMIIPLTRTEAREHDYEWVMPLLSQPLALLGRDADLVDIAFDDASNLVVAVQAESPNAQLLREQDFQRIEYVPRETQAAQLIKLGRADAWFARPMVARAVYDSVGGDPNALVVGPKKHTPPMYLAAAKGAFSEQLCARLRTALAELRADGTYNRIITTY